MKTITKERFQTETGQSIGMPLDYADFYQGAVDRFPSGSVFVEIGVYKGRSSTFLVERMLEAGKIFNIHLVDPTTLHWLIESNPFLCEHCIFHPRDSSLAASRFADKSVDFVWVDADHTEEGVRKDILAWLPKVKAGGVIAGHDYFNQGFTKQVKVVVDDLFPGARISHKSWWQEVGPVTAGIHNAALQFATST